jgi:integrase
MSRIKLQYVQTFNARGHRYFYFRRPGHARIRLPGLPGSAEFMQAYQLALSDIVSSEVGRSRTMPGTISALVVTYYASTAFADLGEATRRYRRWLIEKLRAEAGNYPVKLLEPKHVEAMLAKIAKPHMRKQWLKMLRGLMAYAVQIGMRADDPTAGFKIKQRQGDGIRTWGEDEIEIFRRQHPLGSRARLAFELLLNTVQRRSDVIRMGRQHVRQTADGPVIAVTQQKTKAKLVLPLLPELVAAIEALPTQHLTFLTTANGKPYTGTGFGSWFREQCDAAGLRGFSAHGLRKAGCRRLAEAGCSEKQIAAWSGHRSLAEVARYTRAADQGMLARAAVDKMRTSTVKQADPDCQTMAQGIGEKGK